MKRSFIWGILAVAAIMAVGTPVFAVSFSGNLYYGDPVNTLIATGVWADESTTLGWVVDNETTPGMWHYSYTLDVGGQQGAGISHMIIEVSDTFGFDNLFSPTTDPDGWISPGETEIKTNLPQQGNPDMPGDVYGIKFNANLDGTSVTLSFDSDRAPVWGDFYSKGGQGALWNGGFATTDPTNPPADGSILSHLLVPDTTTTFTVPAPGALVLGSLGVALVGWFRGRRRTI